MSGLIHLGFLTNDGIGLHRYSKIDPLFLIDPFHGFRLVHYWSGCFVNIQSVSQPMACWCFLSIQRHSFLLFPGILQAFNLFVANHGSFRVFPMKVLLCSIVLPPLIYFCATWRICLVRVFFLLSFMFVFLHSDFPVFDRYTYQITNSQDIITLTSL